MPVILPAIEYDRWLDLSLQNPDSLAPLLVPFPPEEMLAFPVSPRVNAPSTDDEKCIAPLP
jgi:putative SOS response-associated peptidase YedK